MTRKISTTFTIIILVLIAIATIWAMTAYTADLPNRISQHETMIFGQTRLVPGSQAAMRVVVRDSKNASPLPGADIRVSLQPEAGGQALTLYQGSTDALGTAEVSFKVPDDARPAEQNLLIETRSSLGSDVVERRVTLERDYRVLISSDKPLYQPGQAIHLRVLALSAFDLRPAAGQNLELVIADGKGNKVFRQQLVTSEYGTAAADFQLASEVNTGAYKISASLGNAASEKTVNVEYYSLPKFEVDLTTGQDFYLPGEHVAGQLQADYFFGKPVAGGQVSLQGYTFDVERSDVFEIQGSTDSSGTFQFDFDLPTYLAGSSLEGGLGRFYLQATVIDQAEHSETSNLSLPVAQNALLIEAIPEGGQFRPGVENILYVLTSYPDGSPAETDLTITASGQPLTASTGAYGLAEVRLTPSDPYLQIAIAARDRQGRTAQQEFYFEGEYSQEAVLLRPDKPVYRVGETMNLTVLTSQPNGNVYLDIIREGQTVSTRSVSVGAGQTQVAVDLTPDLYGTLELHAYKVLRSGTISRDTRLVVVDNAADLNLALTLGQDTYRPGETANLGIQVNGQDGSGAQAAVGLAIVDELVFALAEQDPGFAKLYFLLEQELLTPRYDLHGFSVPDLVSGVPVSSQPFVTAIEDAAQASLAASIPTGNAFSLQANSHAEAMRKALDRQEQYFGTISKGLFGLFLALPLVVLLITLIALIRARRLSQSLALVFGLVIALILVVLLAPLGQAAAWVQTPVERLSYMMDWLTGEGEAWLLVLGLTGVLGYLGLLIQAFRGRDNSLLALLGLSFLALVVLGFLAFNASQANLNPDETALLWGLLIFALLPFAYLLRFADFAVQRKPLLAAAALAVSLLVLFGTLPALAMGSFNRQVGAFRNDVVFDGDVVMEEAMPMMGLAPVPTMAAGMIEAPAAAKGLDEPESGAQPAAEPPRLRQFFPETMLWLPEAVTDAEGRLDLEIPVADSITTWRMTALASTQDGRLGSATAPLRVFQDFFIDLDLPLALTVGDEISVPVGVFNYLAEPQSVRLELEPADWFELLDEPEKVIDIAANDISVVYFRVRALQFGSQPFKVTAWGSQMSDAIQKEVRVYPDGKQLSFTSSDRLEVGSPVQKSVEIPPDAIPGTQSLLVKIYPGVLSQVVEGLDSILRMPNGCFEQTSSSTYPNVLVLDYLQSTDQVAPETQLKAEEYINLGYQRLTTFEVSSSGGFSLFGQPPADRMLTAYGLQEFADMSRVHEVDPDLLRRAAEWLFSQQAADGSWENDRGLVHESTWSSLGNDRLPVTAYIVWSLVDAGFVADGRTTNGLAYIQENQTQAEDPYVLAMVANALVAADQQAGRELKPVTISVLDRLAGLAQQDGSSASWRSEVATFMGGEGQTSSIETTALAALALLRSDQHPELANQALTFLVRQKDSFGTWHSTQTTVLALKSLLESVRSGSEDMDASVTVTLNGGQTHTVQVNAENYDVVQLLQFEDINPGRANVVAIQVEGKGSLMYQISGSYYLPWDVLPQYGDLLPAQDLVSIDVAYDRTELAVNDTVDVGVKVSLNQPGGQAESALIDLGIPPGFNVQAEDLAALVASYKDVPQDYPLPTIERYELTGRQILVYVSNLSEGNPLSFSYRLQAKFPLVAQTPASTAYDYYNPDVAGELAPQTLVVLP